MRLLDLFCGAGGCAVGYQRAGLTEVVGVDHRPQPRYPFDFIQGDALEVLDRLTWGGVFKVPSGRGRWFELADFDAVHASPPCQAYSSLQFLNPGAKERHPDLVEPTRQALLRTGLPWVIENVDRAPLPGAVTVCGSAFGLLVRRHRLFLGSFPLRGTECRHDTQQGRFPRGAGKKGQRGRKAYSTVVSVWGGDGGGKGSKALWQEAMRIDWMTRGELAQAIPPAYTEFVGRQLLAHLQHAG